MTINFQYSAAINARLTYAEVGRWGIHKQLMPQWRWGTGVNSTRRCTSWHCPRRRGACAGTRILLSRHFNLIIRIILHFSINSYWVKRRSSWNIASNCRGFFIRCSCSKMCHGRCFKYYKIFVMDILNYLSLLLSSLYFPIISINNYDHYLLLLSLSIAIISVYYYYLCQ